MTSDRREPAVYVSIEDRSYIGPPLESGRTVYAVILCDRGPDNRIVEITSQREFQEIFGKPNFHKCSQTHYMLNKALEYTGRVLACRVMPGDAQISNTFLRLKTPTISEATSGTSFTFSDEAYDASGQTYFQTTSSTVNSIDERGEKTFVVEVGLSTEILYPSQTVIISQIENGRPNYENRMVGNVIDYNDGTGSLRVDIIVLFGNSEPFDNWAITLPDQYVDEFVYGRLFCSKTQYFGENGELAIGQWVFRTGDNSQLARQVVAKDIDSDPDYVVYTLDAPYTGTTTANSVQKYFPYEISSKPTVTTPDSIIDGGDFLYHFYAVGSGSFYNNIRIRGVRNFEMERLYVDEYGELTYPHVFMDISIFIVGDDDEERHLEGPWTVAIVRKTPNDDAINSFSGLPIYIEDVINDNSKYVRVKSGSQVRTLESKHESATNKRLQVMLAMMNEFVPGSTNVGTNGLSFENGSNGSGLYNSQTGRIDPSMLLNGRIANAYRGSLRSVDGSIESLPEYIYPKYLIDYVVSGGYPSFVQVGARDLAATREDCHHLADIGRHLNNWQQERQARRSMVPWNNWTSSLYTQYRKMRDDYTGENIWMSPVYHALQVHLNTDNKYFLAEPPCNIEKGAISDEIELAYDTNHAIRGDFFEAELNYTIAETNGVYFATQFTTWKRYSALKRQHIAKFVSFLKVQIPKILRDVVQRRASQYWLSQAHFRCNNFFLKFLDGASTDRYACVNSYNINIEFDKTRSEMNAYITFAPILAIERINVFLTIPAEL